MIKNDIINRIEDLKNYTDTSLIEMQKSKIPSYYKLEVEQRYMYDDHGDINRMVKVDSLLYLVRNLPFNINSKNHSFIENLQECVNNGNIFPFLLFLNGRFIKWSEITVIKNCKYAYIKIENYNEPNPKIDCILIPLNMQYKENCNNIENAVFSFNKFGECIDEVGKNQPYTNIYYDIKNVFFEQDRVKTWRQKINLESPKKISKDSLFVFNEGVLDTNITLCGLNTFSIDDRKPIELANRMIYKAFYDEKSNESKDIINNIYNKDYLINKITTEKELPEYLDKLNTTFDFNYSRNKNYSENIADSLNYIMKYNSELMDKVYEERSNIISRTYKGKDIILRADNEGYVKMSRKVSDIINNYVIIFVNGALFKKHHLLQYVNKDFKFPVEGLKDNDVIEILYFKNVDNRITPIRFHSAEGHDIFKLDSTIDLDNCNLFTLDIKDKEYNIERKDSVQYKIDYIYERIDKETVKMYPADNFYYDRDLTLVSKRQFRYAYHICKNDTFNFTLPDSFRFCNEDGKFLIFVNGRRLDNDNFRVTTIKNTRPFDDITVYVNIPAKKGQKIEVFYVPDEMEEVISEKDLDLSGKIVIDKSKLNYNLDKDLYLVFINGKKINISQIHNITSKDLLITTNLKSTKNISIIKHVKDDEVLKGIFKDNDDLLTSVITSIDPKELHLLYKSVQLENTEKDYKSKEIPMKSVMYEIIRKYWMRPYINDGSSFVYDFDDKFLEKDSDGNIIIRAEDANIMDKIQN